VCIDPVDGLTEEAGALSSPVLTETAGTSARFGEVGLRNLKRDERKR